MEGRGVERGGETKINWESQRISPASKYSLHIGVGAP